MKNINNNQGFSAVELLVTLFIAVIFLISGYQLYATIIKDGGEARAHTSASNVVVDYLQKYKNSAANPCTPQTLENDAPISVSGLVNATVTVTIECPSLTATLSSSSQATGGSIAYNGGYAIHTFSSNGTLQVTGSLSNADVLIVAGGVNGVDGGNGGAGGKVTTLSGQTLNGSYNIVVGGTSAASSFGGTTSSGTGAAGGAVGAYNSNGSPGTAGTSSNITGSTVYYGGGGGGGGGEEATRGSRTDGGVGGAGGGGTGGISLYDMSYYHMGYPGANGTANTGGGGGGGGVGVDETGTGGNGGSGVVIVRYPSSAGVITPIKSVSKIIVTVKYGNSSSQQVVTNSTYVRS